MGPGGAGADGARSVSDQSTSQLLIDMVGEEIEHFGWTKAAEITGYNRGYLHHTFGKTRTNHNPGVRVLCDIAEALGITIQGVRK
jgi:DNA-binding phage protein